MPLSQSFTSGCKGRFTRISGCPHERQLDEIYYCQRWKSNPFITSSTTESRLICRCFSRFVETRRWETTILASDIHICSFFLPPEKNDNSASRVGLIQTERRVSMTVLQIETTEFASFSHV